MVATRAELASRFPKFFQPVGAPKVPLIIGIDRMVLDACPDLHPHDVVNALAGYCTGKTYYAAAIAGASRIDLSGEPADAVTVGAEMHARRKLKRRLASQP